MTTTVNAIKSQKDPPLACAVGVGATSAGVLAVSGDLLSVAGVVAAAAGVLPVSEGEPAVRSGAVVSATGDAGRFRECAVGRVA
jgi:hypothetical protein